MCGTPDNIEGIWGDIASNTYGFSNTAAFADTMRDSSISVIFGEGTQLGAYSGGPITDTVGRVVGIVVSVQALPDQTAVYTIGYGIPIAAAAGLWPPAESSE